jgi:hypothetical protein
MLRLTAAFLIVAFVFTVNCVFGPSSVESISILTRLTKTPEGTLNLNPALSDNGQVVVFESSADLAGGGQSASFQAFRGELGAPNPVFTSIAGTRAVSPAVTSDGKTIVFASAEDLVKQNGDRNSEIFLFDGSRVQPVPLSTMS